jgi:hypothetical protein
MQSKEADKIDWMCKIICTSGAIVGVLLSAYVPVKAETIKLECSTGETVKSRQQSKIVFQLDTAKKNVLLYDFDPDFKPETMEKVIVSDQKVSFQGQRFLLESGGKYLEGYKWYSINRYSMNYLVETYSRTARDAQFSKKEFTGTCKKGEIPTRQF